MDYVNYEKNEKAVEKAIWGNSVFFPTACRSKQHDRNQCSIALIDPLIGCFSHYDIIMETRRYVTWVEGVRCRK